MGGAHSLDTPTFLINQDRRVGASDALAKRADQFAQLVAIIDIALKEDQTPRIALAEEFALFFV